MLTIFIRLILIYSLLIGTMRIMGKRQIGQLQISELVTTILLSELAAAPVLDDQIPLAFAIIPIAALISLEVIISFAVTRSPLLKLIFDGKPSVLIDKGQLCPAELSRSRISLEELLGQLRVSGIPDIAQVQYAILEQNGQLSVISKKQFAPPDAGDLHMEIRESGLAHALIVDSVISRFELERLGKDRAWLDKRLKFHRASLSDVFLFTVDDAGKENLIRKPCAHS